MSGDQPAQREDLQFDRADYGHNAPQPLTCRGCGRTIRGVYYEAGGQMLCDDCRVNVESFQASRPGAAGVVKAVGAGIGAGLAGWLLYYAVLRLSGYEFGLIAIVVGYVVGRAVRWGSGGRGGWVFQTIAVIITYVSIVSTSVPMLLQRLDDISLVFVALLALALPFLQGFSNLIGIAILAFGVYEAWRVNRRLKIEVSGPFAPGPGPAA
jgi:hypothetical protein